MQALYYAITHEADILFSYCLFRSSFTRTCNSIYNLHRSFSKLCMFAYYRMKIHVSLRQFDWTILEAVIAPFHLRIFYQKAVVQSTPHIF